MIRKLAGRKRYSFFMRETHGEWVRYRHDGYISPAHFGLDMLSYVYGYDIDQADVFSSMRVER